MADTETWNSAYALGHAHGQKMQEKAMNGPMNMIKKHSGGKIKKTGNYRLRKKELVLTVAQQKKLGLTKSGKKKSSARKRVASKG